jgi:hypothetical protein
MKVLWQRAIPITRGLSKVRSENGIDVRCASCVWLGLPAHHGRYYFGVGGGVLSFCELVEREGVFDVESVWKCDTGVHRDILRIVPK